MQSFNTISLKRKLEEKGEAEIQPKRRKEETPLPGFSKRSAFRRVDASNKLALANLTNLNNSQSSRSPDLAQESKLFRSISNQVESYRVFEKAIGKIDGEEFFTCIKIMKEESKEIVRGILSLDMDDTLIDYKESAKACKPIFLNKEKAQQEIKKAKEKGFKIIINTARPYNDLEREGNNFLSIVNILNELLKGYVSEVYFTNAQDKFQPLLYLQHFHNLKQDKICHKDDNLGFLDDCIKEGFKGVHVQPNSEAHYEEMNQFIETAVSPSISL